MIPRLAAARYVSKFVIHLRFTDGVEGDVDLADELRGPIFEPLQDLDYFQKFVAHPELHTLVWPNDADFAPEFLRSAMRVAA